MSGGPAGLRAGGPSVVAIGGGHGLANSLAAARRYAGRLTAVVSVADDGGSSGRLRAELGIPAPGDLRRCMGALAASDSVLAAALEHRFQDGELAGHAFGNLLIAALAATSGNFVDGVQEANRLLGTVGAVLPATAQPVVLHATTAEPVGGQVEGQVRIMQRGGVTGVRVVPGDAEPPPAVLQAITSADQILIGPGSLYTSLLAALAVPKIRVALEEATAAAAQRVYVANLRQQLPETEGYDVADHVRALSRHGVEVGTVLADPGALALGDLPTGTRLRLAEVASDTGAAHDPARLAAALEQIWLGDGRDPPGG